ncbi:unnamed protein product [Musa acuminata subsp. malaccensis]|uniref:(wild Malaysian banana) hypothetical protein n=1 Tax=Musa acuminata subsp. malaccensis TaxID=214687 RepID=A0A804K3H8_MUSAM|nr:unnamed protein product [Musa acuminata subsp. malaccensis]
MLLAQPQLQGVLILKVKLICFDLLQQPCRFPLIADKDFLNCMRKSLSAITLGRIFHAELKITFHQIRNLVVHENLFDKVVLVLLVAKV